MNKTNYSWQTSLTPYQDNVNKKKIQRFRILDEIRKGADNLLRLSEIIGLPQSTISGRCNDLIQEGRVRYEGKTRYKDYTRKKIVMIKKVEQANLFQ